MRFNIGISAKLSLLMVAVVVAAAGAMGFPTYQRINTALVERELGELIADAKTAGVRLATQIESFRQDTVFLAGTPPIEGIMRARAGGGTDPVDGSSAEVWRERLAIIFTEMLRAKPHYLQVRYIGVADAGREIVRVDRWGAGARTVPEAELQPKGTREYFEGALRLGPGDVYLSEINLNREGGEVVEPRVPVLRAAVPVYFGADEPFGMVIINADMGAVFADLQASVPPRRELYITNNAGDLLYHRNTERTFGFEFGKAYRLQDEFPATAALFTSGANTEGTFVHLHEHEHGGEAHSSPIAVGVAKIPFDPVRPDRFFAMVMSARYADVLAQSDAIRDRSLLVGMLLLPLVAIIGWSLAQSVIRPLRRITEAAEAFGRGEGAPDLPLNTGDEAGQLARAFDTMVQQVKGRTAALAAEIEDRRRAEDQFRQITDASPAGILLVNGQGEIVLANPQMEYMFRYTSAELVGKPIELLVPEAVRERHPELRNAFFANPRMLDLGANRTIRGRRKDGSEFPVDIVLKPFQAGEETHALALVLDITERKQAEDELRDHRARLSTMVDARTAELSTANAALQREVAERKVAEEAMRASEANYRTLATMAPVGIFRTDATGEAVYVNDRCCELIGLTRDEILSAGWVAALHDEDRDRIVTEWYDAARRGEPFRNEYRFQARGGGPPLWVLGQAIAERDAVGRVTGYIGTLTDINDRKLAEEERRRLDQQIQRAQKLESLGVLAGGIAHDFNNLLTAVLTGADLAEMDLPPDSPALEALEQITLAANRAADLTAQMLAYSGGGKFVVERVDFSRLVEELRPLLNAAHLKKTTVKFELAAELPEIEGDITQLRQIPLNLVLNASDAMGEGGGSITITTGTVDADRAYLAGFFLDEELPAGPYVYLDVADTGVGMDAETTAKIFEPFFTTKFAGQGLGLAAVLGIVRSHGGAIKVRSELGRGTVFRVLLPCVETAAARPTAGTSAAAGERQTPASHKPRGVPTDWIGSGTVLVVEDEQLLRDSARRILMFRGLTVLTAEDGVDAVEVYRAHADALDVVLLDMTMPRMDGATAFVHMRKIREDVPVIFMSGWSPEEVAENLPDAAHVDFIQKPYNLNDLVAKVWAALEAHAPAPQRTNGHSTTPGD